MIKKIKIHNIQSHADSELDFDNGINVIIGSSNSGKSAIIRSLSWVKDNRPLGIDTLCSDWTLTDKGKIKEAMSVTIETDKSIVERKRTSDTNQYIINDKTLNVVKTDVPKEVEEHLRLTDTCVQKQLDEPFLLSKSSGDIAKYFNQVIKLDVIDNVLSNAENKKRKIKADIENCKETIMNLKESQKKYDWIDGFETVTKEYQELKNKDDILKMKINRLRDLIDEFDKIQNKIDNLEKIKQIEIKTLKFNKLLGLLADLRGKISDIESSIKLIESKKIYQDFNSELSLINEFNDFNCKLNNIRNKQKKINDNINEYENENEFIFNKIEEIKNLQSQLPEICPLCGGKIKK